MKDHTLKTHTSKSGMPERVPVIASEDLFRGGKEVFIRHQNKEYRLLVTKSGKLILNK